MAPTLGMLMFGPSGAVECTEIGRPSAYIFSPYTRFCASLEEWKLIDSLFQHKYSKFLPVITGFYKHFQRQYQKIVNILKIKCE